MDDDPNREENEEIETPEETPAEEEKVAKAEYDEAKAELEEAKAELEKLRNKDYNFKKLRDGTKDEKKKLTSKEEEIKRIEEDLITRQRSWEEAQLSEAKEVIMESLCGDDKDLRAKLEISAKELNIDAYSKEQIANKYKKAYLLATGMSPQKNSPINASYAPSSSYREKGGAKKYTDTSEGKENYSKWFPNSPSQK